MSPGHYHPILGRFIRLQLYILLFPSGSGFTGRDSQLCFGMTKMPLPSSASGGFTGVNASKTGRHRPASPPWFSVPLFKPVLLVLVPPFGMQVDQFHFGVLRPERPHRIQLPEHLPDLRLRVPLCPYPHRVKYSTSA
jgi:hypothetical protein